ncbi:hypothetical protein GQ607_015882 [Colletotrichum asianum]|uniref:Uncharacterized protein n=1 Tax=Colletotrichum asianum TaxID=702518 RepID=A0A8H3ZEQ3_9PEZI|nr:hypothetical protein GQ607_015882 [Colletotrichum asianum]
MSTEGSHDKPSGQDFQFDASDVIVVLEEEGRPPEVIEQHFQLRARYSPHASVFFRLFPVIDNASTTTTACVQIKAGDIKSLEKEVYGKVNAANPGPAHVEVVRGLLGGMHSVACLRFKLRSHGTIDLIQPVDSDIDNVPGDRILDTCASLRSLVAASLFSLYFRHDILRRKTFNKYVWAVGQFSLLTEPEKQPYQCMVDARRLYHGAGDKVHVPHGHNRPSPTRDRCSPPAPGTPASCGSGSTLPFDEVPPCRGRRGSPPPYAECVTDGQSPSARSDAASMLDTSPAADCGLPEYGDTKRRDASLDPHLAVPPCGNEAIRPTSKRKWSIRATTSSATDAHRPEKLQRSLFVDPDDKSQVAILHDLQEQIRQRDQQNEELQKTVDQLRTTVGELQKSVEVMQTWKKKQEELVGDLEGTCSQLTERQDDFDDAVDCLSGDVDELAGKHDELGKQMIDFGDEFQDLMEGVACKAQEEIRKTIEDGMAKQIQEIVEAQVNEVRRRISKALQPT